MNEAHVCLSQLFQVHILPSIEVKAISKFFNQFCLLIREAHEKLLAFEGDLKEVTAHKSKLLRGAKTFEERMRRVAESTSSTNFSLPRAVLGNPQFHGVVSMKSTFPQS